MPLMIDPCEVKYMFMIDESGVPLQVVVSASKEYFCQFLDLWPAGTVAVGSVLPNTAGPGVFSSSFTSPYKQWDVDKL